MMPAIIFATLSEQGFYLSECHSLFESINLRVRDARVWRQHYKA
jgi:hypothetical protein